MRPSLYPGNQGPVPPRGQNKAVISLYLLRDSDPLPNKIPHSPASLFGNQPISINPNLSRQFWPAPGEPDPDSYPTFLVGEGRIADWDPEPRSCRCHGTALKFLSSLPILEI